MNKSWLSAAVAIGWVLLAAIDIYTAAKIAFGAVEVLGSKLIIDAPIVLGALVMGCAGMLATFLAWDYTCSE